MKCLNLSLMNKGIYDNVFTGLIIESIKNRDFSTKLNLKTGKTK